MEICHRRLTLLHLSLWSVLWRLIHNQVLTDNRCYLENGASSESFFVSEDLPIGSIIGNVRVHGDPRPGGTIALHLQESDSPITIQPGTKNLTLRRRLDKEGVDGPASVFINLICERLHTLDPGFVIPVNIRVTDANDNAPQFVNAPYVLNISEVTVIGTRVLQGVHAIDADQQGPFSNVRYSVLPGPHSDYFEFENELEGTLVLKKSLDFEALRTFDVKIRAQDHGEPPMITDTLLTVHVVDADDQNPKFLDERYTALVPDVPVKGTVLTVKPRDIKAYDQDVGIDSPVYYAFNGAGTDYAYFRVDRMNGRIALARDLTDAELQHPVTLVLRATQNDNADRYALATLTVSRHADDGVRFAKRAFNFAATESLPIGSTIGKLINNKPGQLLKYYVSDQSMLNVFTINPKGELGTRKRLDYEERTEYVFKVFATDGQTNDSCVVNVTVEDVNEWEPRFRYPQYEFFVSSQPNELVGRVEAADGDKSDKLHLTLIGANASMFFVTQNGELRLRELKRYSGTANVAVVATDSGNPPRRASVPIAIHFPGNNARELSANKATSGSGAAILAALCAILLILVFVIALLVAYICKARKRVREREPLPSLQPDKLHSTPAFADRMSNPMFGDKSRSPTATAMGGVPTDSKSRIPSPKVHPAPQPPSWPQNATCSRVKKLSWGDDKTDSECAENMNNMDVPKVTENTNLTVYF